MFLGKKKDPRRGAKEHLCDYWNYVETLYVSKLYLEQQATGGMDKVGQESEVALKVTIYFWADF